MPTLEELILGKKPQQQPFRMQGVGQPNIQEILAQAGLPSNPTGQEAGPGLQGRAALLGRHLGPMTPGNPGLSSINETAKTAADPQMLGTPSNVAPPGPMTSGNEGASALGEQGKVVRPPERNTGVGDARRSFLQQKQDQYALATDFLPDAPVYNAIRGSRHSREIPMNMRAAEQARRNQEMLKYNTLYGGKESDNQILQNLRRDTGEDGAYRQRQVGDAILGRLKDMQPGETVEGILQEYRDVMKMKPNLFAQGKLYPGGQDAPPDRKPGIGKNYADTPTHASTTADQEAHNNPDIDPDILVGIEAMEGSENGRVALEKFLLAGVNPELTEEQLVESLLDPNVVKSIKARKGGEEALSKWFSNRMMHGDAGGGSLLRRLIGRPDFLPGDEKGAERDRDIRQMLEGDASYEATTKKIQKLKKNRNTYNTTVGNLYPGAN